MNYQPSPQFKLVWEDFERWFYNLKVFSAPLLLMYVTSVIPVVSTPDFSLASFIPSPEVRGALTLYVLNAIIDILKKFISENGYKN